MTKKKKAKKKNPYANTTYMKKKWYMGKAHYFPKPKNVKIGKHIYTVDSVEELREIKNREKRRG